MPASFASTCSSTVAINVVIDINGYYVSPNALALGAGSNTAPSLTFGDADGGVYSSSAGVVDVTASGTNILTVNTGGVSVNGTISNNGCTAGWCLQTPTALITTSDADYVAMEASSNGTGSTNRSTG
jgi:hypothetical protein